MIRSLFVYTLSIFLAAPILAHEVRIGYLQIESIGQNRCAIQFSYPANQIQNNYLPKFSISGGWFHFDKHEQIIEQGNVQYKWLVNKSIAELRKEKISFTNLQNAALDVVLSINNGSSSFTKLIKNQNPEIDFSEMEQGGNIYAFFKIGIEHILTGIDHLFFVFCLIIFAVGWRKLLSTITAFTLAHSITLALSTLQIVQLKPQPVEAVIALSIVFVAYEAIRFYKGEEVITAKYPWLIALSFGLLHGFGFAGAIAEVGLPQQNIIGALLFFNLGVEAGQIVFVVLILIIGWMIKRFFKSIPAQIKFIPPYVIGSIAAFWVIERVMAVLE